MDKTEKITIKDALVVTAGVAAVMLVQNLKEMVDEDDWPQMPDALSEAIKNRTPWEVATDMDLRQMLEDARLYGVEEVLASGFEDWCCDEDVAYTGHFTGTARFSDGMIAYEDDALIAFTPDDEGDGTPEGYESRLEDMFGEGFPYARFIGTVEGEYIS